MPDVNLTHCPAREGAACTNSSTAVFGRTSSPVGWPPGGLPSKRMLAEHLNVSVVTVENAYAQLMAEGYLFSRPKRGFLWSGWPRTASTARPPANPRPA